MFAEIVLYVMYHCIQYQFYSMFDNPDQFDHISNQ